MNPIHTEVDKRFAAKDSEGTLAMIDFGLAHNPFDTVLYRAKAKLFHSIKDPARAKEWYTAAIKHSVPNYEDRFNRASVRNEMSDYPGVIEDLDVAELFRTDDVNLYLKRGGAHWEMRDWTKASDDFQRALKLDPNHPDAIWINGLLDLQLGKFDTAWERYDARWKSQRFKSNRLVTKKPQWSPDSGLRRVLVWGEQGIGDQIFYASALRHLRFVTDKVTMLVDPRLISLFSRSLPEIDFLPNTAEVPIDEHDSHLPIASIHAQFVRSLDDIPKYAARNYLKPDPKRVALVREKLGEGFTAVSWTSAAIKIGPHKSISLEAMEPILSISGRRFVNVQYVTSATENRDKRIIKTDINCRDDFENLAALLSLADCLVSVSSSTVHLAAALGVRVHLADANKLWYWGNKDGDQSLWYPSVTVYPRDNVLAPWTNVIDRISQDLRKS